MYILTIEVPDTVTTSTGYVSSAGSITTYVGEKIEWADTPRHFTSENTAVSQVVVIKIAGVTQTLAAGIATGGDTNARPGGTATLRNYDGAGVKTYTVPQPAPSS